MDSDPFIYATGSNTVTAVLRPANMTTPIRLQLKYAEISFQIQLNFQGKTMIFLDQIDICSSFYLKVVHLEVKQVHNSIL